MLDTNSIDWKNTPVSELVPHKETMLLLDRVNWVSNEAAEAETIVRNDGLFNDVSTTGYNSVPAWLGMEYMAQTIAAYAGALGRQAGQSAKIGFLLGTRSFRSNVAHFSVGTQLSITAQQLLQGENGMAAFQCKVTGTDLHTHTAIEQVATLNVFQPDNPEQIFAAT